MRRTRGRADGSAGYRSAGGPPEPWRGPGPGRPDVLAALPDGLALVHRGRLRKAWRYVGVFSPELSLCVGVVHVGPATQRFWAVWDRRRGRLLERTRLRGGAVALGPERVEVREPGVLIDLVLDEGPGIEVCTPSGRAWTWTRKQGDVPARGRVEVGGTVRELQARAVVDDSAGYHPRETSWSWTAGVGRLADGRRAAWNLVAGLNDAPRHSERTVWIDGEAHEVGPVAFSRDLERIELAEGGALRAHPEAVRERRDDLLVVRSTYRQPFASFSGVLGPGAGPLAEAHGVCERHEARW